VADYYCSKNGDDANGGTSWADAKLTIQATATVAANGDTLHIGQGVYAETVTTGNEGYFIRCYDKVIVDAESARAYCWYCGNVATRDIEVQTPPGSLVFANATSRGLRTSSTSSWTTGVHFKDCVRGKGYNTAYAFGGYVNHCVFEGCEYGMYYDSVSYNRVLVKNCLFYNNDYGVRSLDNIFTSYNNIFIGNTYNWYFDNAGTATAFDYNWYDLVSGVSDNYFNGVSYGSLAHWQSGTSQDANSVSGTAAEAGILDIANGSFRLDAQSPCRSNGYRDSTYGVPIYMGPFPYPSVGWSDGNISASDFTGWTLDRLEIDSNGDLCLSGTATSGVGISEVWNLGYIRRLRLVNFCWDENYNTFPDYKIDALNTSPETDDMPNRAQMYYRCSKVSQAACESAAWVEMNAYAVQDPGPTGQWWQFKLVFRKNGVA